MSAATATQYQASSDKDYPLPVSATDQLFLARISSTLEDIKMTKVGGSSGEQARPKSRYGSSIKIQQAMAEKKRDHHKREETREKVLLEKEKDLWENQNWRDRVKDLSSSFSKLTPINEGNKIVAGRGQAFVVDLDLLEDLSRC